MYISLAVIILNGKSEIHKNTQLIASLISSYVLVLYLCILVLLYSFWEKKSLYFKYWRTFVFLDLFFVYWGAAQNEAMQSIN